HLHGFPEAEGRALAYEPTDEQLEALEALPIYEVANKGEVDNYLGFRHIGGLKPWEPEAKARYLARAVDEASDEGVSNPFNHVAKQFGSNTQGVRNSYIALITLRHARDVGRIDIGYVLRERFTVWLRCMNSSDIRRYIGLGP